MTDPMMTLQNLLAKSSDADVLRQMIGYTAQRLMELEVESRTGVVGIFPNVAAVTRLVGAMLHEKNDEWAVERARYLPLATNDETCESGPDGSSVQAD